VKQRIDHGLVLRVDWQSLLKRALKAQ